jgi:hypothetical protein
LEQVGTVQYFGPGLERGVPFPCPKDITAGPFLVNVYEDTGEAVIVFHSPRESPGAWRTLASGEWEVLVDERSREPIAYRRVVLEDVKAERNLKHANLRARAKFRRYCVKNRLSKMWTLTYAAVTPKAQVKRDVNAFMQRWRDMQKKGEFPYAYVFELHEDGVRWHVHLAVPVGYTDKHRLQALWGLGLVHFKESPWVSTRGIGGRERSRRLAHYLAKYLDKSFGDVHVPGEHRYEVAQGFGVKQVRRLFWMFDSAVAWLMTQERGQWELVWESAEIERWDGPDAWGYRSG